MRDISRHSLDVFETLDRDRHLEETPEDQLQ
jgi:hypothetical protein